MGVGVGEGGGVGGVVGGGGGRANTVRLDPPEPILLLLLLLQLLLLLLLLLLLVRLDPLEPRRSEVDGATVDEPAGGLGQQLEGNRVLQLPVVRQQRARPQHL